MRRDSPVPGMMRVAVEDVTFKGVCIPNTPNLLLRGPDHLHLMWHMA